VTRKRIQVLDALRGFTLAGIVIIHMLENYIGAPAPETGLEGTTPYLLDKLINGIMFFLIRGKFFALFSFLFGVSFFIQMRNAENKNINLSGRFIWRLVILLCIGAAHHLFYRGDILTIYALTGLLLIPFYKASNRVILVSAIVLFAGLGRYLIFITVGGDAIFSNFDVNPQNPSVIAYFDTIKNGSLKQVFASNTIEGHLMKLDFQYGIFGRGYLTFAFFLLGLYAGKISLFERYQTLKKQMKKGLLWSIICTIAGLIIMAIAFALATDFGQKEPDFNSWLVMIGLSFYDISNLFFTLLIMILFLYAFMRAKGHLFLMRFAPYGRMALTNYILQSIIGTALLYGWGLGFIGEIPHSIMVLIALAFIVLQISWSKWWLAHFTYGPLEWFWRSLTYFKRFPFRKKEYK
jgi:uncharacterized protein